MKSLFGSARLATFAALAILVGATALAPDAWAQTVSGRAATQAPAAGAPAQTPRPAGAANGGGGGGLADPYVGKKKLLIWADVQSGFHHDDINHAMAVIERLGRESGAYVSVIRTDSQVITKRPILGYGTRYNGRSINARNLDQYDAIFFLGAGEGTLNSQQKADLLAFVHDDGKGLVVGHAAGVAFFDWPEWGNLIGGFMGSEYSVHPTALTVQDPNFPGVQGFAKSFTFTDQFPVMKAPYEKGQGPHDHPRGLVEADSRGAGAAGRTAISRSSSPCPMARVGSSTQASVTPTRPGTIRGSRRCTLRRSAGPWA